MKAVRSFVPMLLGFCTALPVPHCVASPFVISIDNGAQRQRAYFGARCQGGFAAPESACLWYRSAPPFLFPPPQDAPPVGNAGVPVYNASGVMGEPVFFEDTGTVVDQRTNGFFRLVPTVLPVPANLNPIGILWPNGGYLLQRPATPGIAFMQLNYTVPYGISGGPMLPTPWGWRAILICNLQTASSYCRFEGEAQFWVTRGRFNPVEALLGVSKFSFVHGPGAPRVVGPLLHTSPVTFLNGFQSNTPWVVRVIGYVRLEVDPGEMTVIDASASVLVDPFQCYEVRRRSFAAPPVHLTDRFGSADGVFVSTPERLCAPADVQGADPSAPSHAEHLVGYRVRHAFTRLLGQQFVDQFGSVTLDVVRPDRLLVPSTKRLDAPADPLPTPATDHFQCYVVRKSHGAPRFVAIPGVTVADQFGSTTVTLTRPTRLCAPADKNHESPGAETHPDHLLCYRARPTPFPTVAANVNNQFGANLLSLIHRTELCVPAMPLPAVTTSTVTVTTTTSTTTTTLYVTQCCEFPGTPTLCFDALPADAGTKCALLGGTLQPGACDPTLGACVPPPVSPDDWCCECPTPAPPFPHPQLCFEGVLGNEAQCQPPCVLSAAVACGAVTEQCGGSPSGAFIDGE